MVAVPWEIVATGTGTNIYRGRQSKTYRIKLTNGPGVYVKIGTTISLYLSTGQNVDVNGTNLTVRRPNTVNADIILQGTYESLD